MRCRKFRKILLTDGADGEISADTRSRLLRHLESCEKCRGLEEAISDSVMRPLKVAERPVLSEDLWPRIKSAVEQSKEPARTRDYFTFFRVPAGVRRPACVLATALALALVFMSAKYRADMRERELLSYVADQFLFLDSLGWDNWAEYEDIGIMSELIM